MKPEAGWVTGFVDGEGCFHVGVNAHPEMAVGFQVLPEFTVVQHERDAQLLHAARTDPQAFREIYERYAVWMRSWFARQTGSETAALDLTAETFAQAWHASKRFKDMADGSGAPWLFGIARNLLRQYHKHNRIESAARERLGMPTAWAERSPRCRWCCARWPACLPHRWRWATRRAIRS